MWYVLTGAAGAIATLVTLWRLAVWKGRAETYRRSWAEATGEVSRLNVAQAQAQANHLDQVRRINDTLGWYKVEITRLEASLNACNVPGTVRDRLRGLLSGPGAPGQP